MNNPQRPVVSDSSSVPDASRSMKGEFEQTKGGRLRKGRNNSSTPSPTGAAIDIVSQRGFCSPTKPGLILHLTKGHPTRA